MPKIKMIEAARPAEDIVIRGGNHHMKPDDIYIRIPRKKLVELGFLKDGELPNDSTASAVRRALKFDIRAVPDTRFGGNDFYLTISSGDISKEYYLEEYWYTQQGSSFENWLRNTHLTIRPEEPWERKSEAVLNRITMHDARKKCAALQKSGKLSNCLHEVTAAIALVQNALANSSPEIKDNTLNFTEKKIVARAVLAEIVSNFNYEPEDLR